MMTVCAPQSETRGAAEYAFAFLELTQASVAGGQHGSARRLTRPCANDAAWSHTNQPFRSRTGSSAAGAFVPSGHGAQRTPGGRVPAPHA